ncbi:MAG: 30S ribosomal protein S2 [Candidatus Eisenbacteria bacterium]
MVDTNCDPDEVTYPIPGNDDAIRSLRLFSRWIGDTVLEARASAPTQADKMGDRGERGDKGEPEAATAAGN